MKKNRISKPKNPKRALKKRLDALEDRIRQEQAKEIGIPYISDGLIGVPPEWLTIDDVLAVAKEGGNVQEYPCFAKVRGSHACYWSDSEGESQTWDEFFAGQYPHISPTPANGLEYFGLHPNGKHLSGEELLALSRAGVDLISAEEFKTETATEETP